MLFKSLQDLNKPSLLKSKIFKASTTAYSNRRIYQEKHASAKRLIVFLRETVIPQKGDNLVLLLFLRSKNKRSTRLFPMRSKACKENQIEDFDFKERYAFKIFDLVAFQIFDFNKQVLRLVKILQGF